MSNLKKLGLLLLVVVFGASFYWVSAMQQDKQSKCEYNLCIGEDGQVEYNSDAKEEEKSTLSGHASALGAPRILDEDGNSLTAKDISELFLNNPEFVKGQPLYLYVSNFQGAEQYLTELSKTLESPLAVPPDTIWFYPKGNLVVAPAIPDPETGRPIPDMSRSSVYYYPQQKAPEGVGESTITTYFLTPAEIQALTKKAENDKESAYRLYEFYEYSKADHSSSMQWLEKAAQQGHITAQYNLGYQLQYDPTRKDLDKAKYWYKRAAQKKHKYALKRLEELS